VLLGVQGVGVYANADPELLDLCPDIGRSKAEAQPRDQKRYKNDRFDTNSDVFHANPPLFKVSTNLLLNAETLYAELDYSPPLIEIPLASYSLGLGVQLETI
jgi:hypothetical protein